MSTKDDSEFWPDLVALSLELDERSYYELVGVRPDCASDELRAALYRRVAEVHPDGHAGQRDPMLRQALVRVYERLAEASKVLSNAATRREYDQRLAAGEKRLLNAAASPVRPAPVAAPARPAQPVSDFAREHTRQPFSRPVRVGCASWDQFIVLHARNISRGGLFVRTASPSEVGTLVELRIDLPGGQNIVLAAEVARVIAPERATAAEPAGMGLRFLELDDEARQHVDALLREARAGVSHPTPHATKAASPPAPAPRPAAGDVQEELASHLLRELARMREIRAHEVLGVAADADEATVRTAYLRLTKRYHPDVYARFGVPTIDETVSELFTLVRRAYERLRGAAPAAPPRAAATPSRAPAPMPPRPAAQAPARAPTPARVIRPLAEADLFGDDLAPDRPEAPPDVALDRRGASTAIELKKALADLKLGRFIDASARLAPLLQHDQENPSLRAPYHLALGYQAKVDGNLEQARIEFERVLRADKQCEEAIRELRAAGQSATRGIWNRFFKPGDGK